MRILLQGRRVGATQWSSRGEGGGGGRKWLDLEKSLDWVRLKLLLMVVVLLMMMEQMVMVVMLQRHPVVTQPVLGGLGHGLKHSYDPSDPSLSLHELLDGWAVLRLVLLLLLMGSAGTGQQTPNISTIYSDSLSTNRSPEPSI